MKSLKEQTDRFQKNWETYSHLFGIRKAIQDPLPHHWIGIHLAMDLYGEMKSIVRRISEANAWHSCFWLPPEQMHITLMAPGRADDHFSQKDIPYFKKTLISICEHMKTFEIELGDLNCFPSALFREVYDPSDQLQILHTTIADTIPTSHKQFIYDDYLPHVSLGYVDKEIKPLLDSTFDRSIGKTSMVVQSVQMSVWTPVERGLHVEPIAHFDLKK